MYRVPALRLKTRMQMLHKLFDAPEISLSQIYAKVTVPAGQSLQQ